MNVEKQTVLTISEVREQRRKCAKDKKVCFRSIQKQQSISTEADGGQDEKRAPGNSYIIPSPRLQWTPPYLPHHNRDRPPLFPRRHRIDAPLISLSPHGPSSRRRRPAPAGTGPVAAVRHRLRRCRRRSLPLDCFRRPYPSDRAGPRGRVDYPLRVRRAPSWNGGFRAAAASGDYRRCRARTFSPIDWRKIDRSRSRGGRWTGRVLFIAALPMPIYPSSLNGRSGGQKGLES